MSFLQALKLLLLQYARSLVLERYEKLVCGSKIFIDWTPSKIRLVHILYTIFTIQFYLI